MHDKTSNNNPSSNNGSHELKAYTTALIKAVLYDGDDIEEYLPEVKRLAFKHTVDYAAFEFNLSRFVELYRNCQAKNKFNEPNMLALNNLCSELGVEPDVLRISDSKIIGSEIHLSDNEFSSSGIKDKPKLGDLITGAGINDDLYKCLLRLPKYTKKEDFVEKKERLEFLSTRIELLFKYDEVDPLRYGLAKVSKGNNIGFVNKNGDLIIPLEFDLGTSYNFTGNFAVVGKRESGFFSKKTKDLIIDNTGNITYSFSRSASYRNTWLDETLDKYVQIVNYYGNDKTKHGLIDMYGKTLFETKYDWIEFSEGLFIYKQDGYYGIMDSEKNELLPTNQFVIIEYDDGIIEFQDRNDKYCEFTVFDRKNNKVTKIDKHFDSREPFNDGLSVVGVGYKYGAINTDGVEVIPIIYDRLGLFHEGFAAFTKNGRFGYLDKYGNEVIPPIYDDARLFKNGLAEVKKNGKWGFVNSKGNLVIPFKYTSPFLGFDDGIGSVFIGNSVYFINENGDILKKRKD